MKSGNKFRINLLCSVGLIYFFVVPLLIIGLFVGIAVLMIALDIHSGIGKLIRYVVGPLGIVVWLMFRGFFTAIFTKLPEPEGVELTSQNIPPKLNAVIEDIGRRLKCPRIHSIRLSPGNNAFITEQPSLGMLGFYRRYLVIGLPLLTHLDVEELSAIIAHECGHIAGAHGRTGVRIERARHIWQNVAEELKRKGKDKYFFISRFLYWYIPALNDAHYRISRQYELDSDAASIKIAGSAAAARALMKIIAWDSLLDMKFWPEFIHRDIRDGSPPNGVFTRMRAFVAEGFDAEHARKLLEKITGAPTLPDSTHPSPAERVRAMGEGMPAPESLAAAAAPVFDSLPAQCIAQCERMWRSGAAQSWKQMYTEWKEMRKRLDALEQKRASQELTPDEAVERALLLEKSENAEAGRAAFGEILAANPENASAMFHLGRLMLGGGDEEGAGLIEQAMEEDAQLIPEGCYVLMNHNLMQGDREKAAGYYHYAVEFMKTNEEVKRERDTLRIEEISLEPDLSYESILRIREALAQYPKIKKAYVAKLNLKYSGQFQSYVLCFKHGYGSKKADQIREVLSSAQFTEWECWIVDLNRHKQIEYIVDAIPNSRIL